MYPYITLNDDTLITHSHLIEKDDEQIVKIHFERPKDGGFDMARCVLPSYEWIIKEGYTEKEIAEFENMIKQGEHIFYKYAAIGGMEVAKAI